MTTLTQPVAPETTAGIDSLPCPCCGEKDQLVIDVASAAIWCKNCDDEVEAEIQAAVAGYGRLLKWAAACPRE